MTLAATAMAIVDTARISVPTVLEAALRTSSMEASDRRLAWWADKLLRNAGVDLHVEGREHAGDGTEALLVMSNHQSHYDIPVIFCAVPGRIRMVTKAELFKVPIWGPAMRAAGFIEIDRRSRDKAMGALRGQGESLLAAGTRVWIAPEGTRSRTGALGPFKSGGFRMALETGTRILPVAIQGTREVLPADGVVVRVGKRVVVTILPPVDPARYGEAGRKELMAEVRARIASVLGQA
jgi:1-acyl-sn-glycerol-3-phosphate acyltransferase